MVISNLLCTFMVVCSNGSTTAGTMYAILFYFTPSHSQLLGISAIILANLCVSYIMTSHTEEVQWVCARYVTNVILKMAVDETLPQLHTLDDTETNW